MLDLESIRLFVLAVEYGNLTRAAEAAGTVQPVVSQRLKSLEAALGRRLLDRTPRYVRPTPDGAAFLARARNLLAAHDAAIEMGDRMEAPFSLGISDHALGFAFEAVLRRLKAALAAESIINVRLSLSHGIREMFENGDIDAAVVRREGGGSDGEVLGRDPVGWRAAEGWTPPPGGTVPLVLLPPPCGVRAVAIRALDRSGLSWREAFVGGSCASLLAASNAGLGVTPMGRLASGGMPDRGPHLGLPELPPSEIVLLARAATPQHAAAVRALAAGIRAALG
jgi:DNA-binding transcriptional LysR family regulator